MNKLTIYRLFFTQSDCYRAGVRQKMVGVQVHSTGANNTWLHRYVGPDDGRLGPNEYGNHSNKPGSDVCASAYIGRLQNGDVAVYQTLPWDMRCWLSGSGKNGNANKLGYIGFEICEDECINRPYFEAAVMEAAVLLTAHLCQLIGADPWQVLATHDGHERYPVMDHAELHACSLASNHGDITHWLHNQGYTMTTFREWVRMAMEEGVEVKYIDASEPPQPQPTPTGTGRIITSPNGGYVNGRSGPSIGAASLVQLRPGSQVEAIEQRDGWTHVQADFWVRDDLLKNK